jgi:hypothetical protein
MGDTYWHRHLFAQIICHDYEQEDTVNASIKDKLNEEFEAVLRYNTANPILSQHLHVDLQSEAEKTTYQGQKWSIFLTQRPISLQ